MDDTLFISHSNPEDNYFGLWLASKLRLLGYKVWIDVDDLLAGDSFWSEIERQIRTESNRFISIVSESYISKARTAGSGIQKEIRCAQTRKEKRNFILPIRKDASNFDDFSIDLLEFDCVDFSSNWGSGLHELVNNLERLNVPRFDSNPNTLQLWFDAMRISPALLDRKEAYHCNWFELKIPATLYVHQPEYFDKEEIAEIPYPSITVADRIICFYSEETARQKVELRSSYAFSVSELVNQKDFRVDDRFTMWKPNRIMIQLINTIFDNYFGSRGLRIYEQSQRNKVYYFDYGEENRGLISLKKYGKSRRAVVGAQGGIRWHFGISHFASFFPWPLLRMRYHLIFSSEQDGILGKDDQHALRRSVPSFWYNRKWYETLMAMMVKICHDPDDMIARIEVDSSTTLDLAIQSSEFEASVGYKEPENEDTAEISE